MTITDFFFTFFKTTHYFHLPIAVHQVILSFYIPFSHHDTEILNLMSLLNVPARLKRITCLNFQCLKF